MKKLLVFLISIASALLIVGCTPQPHDEKTADETISHQPINETENKIVSEHEISDHLKVHYIDVGQGDSTLFQFSEDGEEYAILIDAGDFTGDEVIEYLQANGLSKVNIAIGTHPDADHIGQLDRIINTFKVDEVWLSGNTSSSDTFQRVLEAIDENDVGYEEPRMGDQFEVGSLNIEVLYPQQITGKVNEESISLKLTYGEVSFIFTGDAEKGNELEMVESGANLKADFLHLGHHGSSTSTSNEFLKAVNPKIAIYSAGAGNSYGHPNEEVVSLVQKSGIKLYGTDIHGTIIVTTDGKKYSIETNKQGTFHSPKTEENTTAQKDTDIRTTEGCVNINTATSGEVEQIIHIGPERAEDLIEQRPYQSVDDLSKIKGIGPARIEDIKEEGLACVGG